MLVIGRKQDEKLIIEGGIEITILKVGRNYVKFGIEAPRDVPVQKRTKVSEPGASWPEPGPTLESGGEDAPGSDVAARAAQPGSSSATSAKASG